MLAQIFLDGPYVFGILAGAGSVIAFMFKLILDSEKEKHKILLESKDAQLEELRSLNKTYLGLADEAYRSNLKTTNYYREKYEGKPPLAAILPVIAEGSSPSTQDQQDSAHLAKLRTGMVKVKEATGQMGAILLVLS